MFSFVTEDIHTYIHTCTLTYNLKILSFKNVFTTPNLPSVCRAFTTQHFIKCVRLRDGAQGSHIT